MIDEKTGYEGYAIVELMGHRRIAGRVQQVEMYGTAMLRIDIPGPDVPVATQFYGGSAIYCLTPTTEEIARAVALRNQPQPVQRWEMLPVVELHKPHQDTEDDGDYQ